MINKSQFWRLGRLLYDVGSDNFVQVAAEFKLNGSTEEVLARLHHTGHVQVKTNN